jgi:hypothetical protein
MPFWIYPDLFHVFTRWDNVSDLARENLARRSAEIYQEIRASQILEQTRDLHKDTSTVIALREIIRIQPASAKRLLLQVRNLSVYRMSDDVTLQDRLIDIIHGLQHDQVTFQTILEQLQNLLSLVRILGRVLLITS